MKESDIRPKKLFDELRSLFEHVRVAFQWFVWDTWTQFYEMLHDPEAHPPPNGFGSISHSVID